MVNKRVIEARSLAKTVASPEGGYLDILRGVDMHVNREEAVAILGLSGSGKSTLLGLPAGLDDPTDGTVTLLGQRLDALDEDGRAALRLGRVGFVFQSFQLLDGLTALENVCLPLNLAGRCDARERAVELLQEVGLGPRLAHRPEQLSGGSSGLPWPGPLPDRRRFCLRMNPRAIWTRRPGSRSHSCCSTCVTATRPAWCW